MTYLRYSCILIMLITFCSLRTIAQSEFYQIGFELYKGTSPDFSDIVYCNLVSGGNAGIDNADLPKLDQFAENVSVYRNLRDFAIETRPLVNCTDTIQLRLYKTPTTTTNFRIVVDLKSYQPTPGLIAVMQDRFLNNERPLKFGDTTNILFTITSNTNTTGLRFRVVFRRTQVTTDPFTQLPAICRGEAINLPATSSNGVKGTWTPAVNNTATTNYTFIPSEGQCATSPTMTVQVNQPVTPIFSPIGPFPFGTNFTLPSTSGNGITGSWLPAINNTQTTTYTFTPDEGQCASPAQMTVTINNVPTSLTDLSDNQSFHVYPNPVNRGTASIQLELGDFHRGKYVISLFALNGLRLYDIQLQHPGGTSVYQLPTDQIRNSGAYLLRIKGEKEMKSQKILFIR